METTYTCRVTLTDRTRTADGDYTRYTALVDVLASSATEASLVATQLATAIRCDLDCMPLACEVVDGPV